jgi:hypothetical protein
LVHAARGSARLPFASDHPLDEVLLAVEVGSALVGVDGSEG